MVEQLVLGRIYRVSKPVSTKCCTYILQPGAFVRVERVTSPNRVMIGHQEAPLEAGDMTHADGHKVRKSTLRMSVEEIEEETNMRQEFTREEHHVSAEGNPAGGQTLAVGLSINWQDGPLGRGAERKEPNGAFVETVIQAAIGRLEFYQASKFACTENGSALEHLARALGVLEERTKDRERRAVEGTHSA